MSANVLLTSALLSAAAAAQGLVNTGGVLAVPPGATLYVGPNGLSN